LAILPKEPDEIAFHIVNGLSEIAHKGKTLKHNLFPFYVVPEHNPGYALLTKNLGLTSETEVIAINTRRGWYRKLPIGGDKITAKDVTEELLFDWVESIKLGEGSKLMLPEGLVVEEIEEDPIGGTTQEPLKEVPPVEEGTEEAQSVINTKTEEADTVTATTLVEEVDTKETVIAERESHDEL